MKNIRLLTLSTALVLSLSACSSTMKDISDGITGDWFTSDEEVADADQVETVPREEEPFPKIGVAPERPETPSIAEDFDKLQSGLVADNANAHYTDQVIRSQQIPTETKSKPVAVSVATGKPVPAPVSPPTATAIKQTATGPKLDPQAATVAKVKTPAVPKVVAKPAPKAVPVEKPSVAPKAQPVTAEAPKMFDVTELVKTDTQAQSVAPLETPQLQASEEAIVALSANRAEEQATKGTHIATLYYSVGNAVLSSNDKAILAQVANLYGQNAYSGLVVIGHASIPVSPAVQNPTLINYKVSLDRAVNVVDTMQALGIPSDLITMDARGANQPIRSGNTPEDHAFNRRAEIYFLN